MENTYTVGFWRWRSWYHDSEHATLEAAVIRALDLNDDLSDGDNGISAIRFGDKEAPVGNGTFRAVLLDDNYDDVERTPHVIRTIAGAISLQLGSAT